jgi:hypothetical protein
LTFILVAKDGKSDTEERQAIKGFVQYAVTSGQAADEELSYAKLPVLLQQLDQQLLSEMTANGQSLK